MKQAHVPNDVVFEPALASQIIKRSLATGVPFCWVAADSVYGVGEVKRTLRQAAIGYVLGVKGNHWSGSWITNPLITGKARDIAADLPDQAWQPLSAGRGPKGITIQELVNVEGARWRIEEGFEAAKNVRPQS